MERDRLKLAFVGHFFFHLNPLQKQKKKKSKFWKSAKNCWRYHHFAHVHQKSWSYDAKLLRYGVRQTRFFLSFWAIFCPSTPSLMTRKNQNFARMKNALGDIIILHMCTINHNHIMYASWDKECNRCFCHYEPFFAL